jgi:hypothetical protein
MLTLNLLQYRFFIYRNEKGVRRGEEREERKEREREREREIIMLMWA